MDSVEQSVFHLHPLQRCNLRCLHCYSDSSPHVGELLPQGRAKEAVTMAARWGYRALAVSGGEPLLYPGLSALLEHARNMGMCTSVVTNGLLCRTRRDTEKLRHADTVTVSLDGLAVQHNRMRGRDGAFAGASTAVCRLADAGLNTWVACGVTAENVCDVEELTATVASWGARGIAFHLVEPAGRAASLPQAMFLTPDARVLLYAAVTLLAAMQKETIEIHLDLLHRDTVLRHPALIYAVDEARSALPAHSIRVLVMYPDGTLVPVCHGFNDRYAVGCPEHAADSDRMWDAFFNHTFPALTALGRAALEELRQSELHRVLNPGDWLAERSHAQRHQLVRNSAFAHKS